MYLFLLLPLLLFTYASNNHLSISDYQLPLPKRKQHPSALSVVQISDLHNKSFGTGQIRLIKRIASLRPDLIAVTGDLVDGAPYRHAVTFLKQASQICPVYMVRGNHESLAGNFKDLEQELAGCEIYLLKNTSKDFQKDGYTYRIAGLDDPAFKGRDRKYAPYMKKTLEQMLRRQTVPNRIIKFCCHTGRSSSIYTAAIRLIWFCAAMPTEDSSVCRLQMDFMPRTREFFQSIHPGYTQKTTRRKLSAAVLETALFLYGCSIVRRSCIS